MENKETTLIEGDLKIISSIEPAIYGDGSLSIDGNLIVSGNINLPGLNKGDILVYDGSNLIELPVGTNGFILSSNSLTASGLEWVTESVSTASNLGLGVGVFKQLNGSTLEFKSINNASSKISIIDDTGNDEVDIDIVEANVIHDNLSGAGTNTHAQIDTHIASTTNPHSVTIDQVTPTITKGDILVEDGANVIRLPVGTNGFVLSSNSLTASGLEWVTESVSTASNLGLGVGVFKLLNGSTLEFKSINNASSKISIIDDTGNDEVDIDIVEANVIHDNLSGAGTNTHAQIDTHIASTTNPHSVTIDQVTPTTTKGDILVEDGANVIKLPVGTDGFVLSSNSLTASGLEWVTAIGGGGSGMYAVITDQKPIGTNGGSFIKGAWLTRDLNTLVGNASSRVSLAANQITLNAGSYFIYCSAPGSKVHDHTVRFRNITDATTVAYGSSASCDKKNVTNSFASGYVSIASSKTFELQHRCSHTENNSGFGIATGWQVEVYGRVNIIVVN